jgi:glycosyltransferase involved in cell wall biosynthesis
VEPENVDQMAETILQLWSKKDVLEEMGKNGRVFVERYFNRDDLAKIYLGLLREVAGISH